MKKLLTPALIGLALYLLFRKKSDGTTAPGTEIPGTDQATGLTVQEMQDSLHSFNISSGLNHDPRFPLGTGMMFIAELTPEQIPIIYKYVNEYFIPGLQLPPETDLYIQVKNIFDTNRFGFNF